MPSSYRQPDRRDEDRIVYFDYAKSLESRRLPIPWGLLARRALVAFVALLVVSAVAYLTRDQGAAYPVLTALTVLVCVPGAIPLMRSNRALSGENFSSVKRGR